MKNTIFKGQGYKVVYVAPGILYTKGQAVISSKAIIGWKHVATFKVYDEQEAQVLFTSLMRQPNEHGVATIKHVWHDRLIQVEL